MKKYSGCPEELTIVEEHALYVRVTKIRTSSSGGLNSLIVPAQYWPRFVTDEQWRNSMMSSYSQHIFTVAYPEKIVMLGGRPFRNTGGMAKPGKIPEGLPFLTKFPNCPSGYGKDAENDDCITLYCRYQAGMMGGKLIVPADLWSRFTTDSDWRKAMTLKYARMLELDADDVPEERLAKIPDSERRKTGIIPEKNQWKSID
jgi:hypothetical protein